MPADLPYDRDVDREAIEKRREGQRRAERRVEIKNEMRRRAGVFSASRREAGSAPLTERAQTTFTVGESERIQRVADELGVSVRTLLRAGALILASRLEGRP